MTDPMADKSNLNVDLATPLPKQTAEEKWAPKVPGAVREAAARAEELHKQTYTPEGETQPEGGAEPQGSPPAAEATPPVPAQPAPTQTPPVPAARDWERDFNAMHGRWEREAKANKDLLERVKGLETLVAQMKTQPPPEVKPVEPRQRLVTDEEEKDYGADLLQVVGKKAKDELLPEIEELRKEITYLKGGVEAVGSTVAKSSTDRLYDDLGKAVPNWQELNQDEEFKGWLSQVDPYAGRKRWDMLTEAFNRHDSPRVVNFFQGYLSEAAVTDPQNPPRAPASSPAPNGAAQGKVPLAQFAAPGRAGPAAPSGPADRPLYTRAQIAQFYRDMSAGKWRGREADASAIDADIIAAGREGRIR